MSWTACNHNKKSLKQHVFYSNSQFFPFYTFNPKKRITMGFLFTSESVSEGHPDKVSDQISDAILDEFLRHDANSKVACETLCPPGLVVVAGGVRSDA